MRELSLLTLQIKRDQLLELLSQCIFILVCVLILFNPYPHVTAIKEISFYGSVLILLPLVILKKTDFSLRTPLSIPFLLFVLWSFCGLFFALNKGNSIHDFFAHLIKHLVIFYLLFNFFATKERLLILIWTIVISTALYSAGMMLYFYFILGEDISTKLGLYMTEIPSNIIGISTWFATLLALFQMTREPSLLRKVILTICICATAIATLATQTRGTILAVMVSLLLSLPRNKKVLFFFFLFLASVILVMPVKNKMTPSAIIGKIASDDRVKIWYCFAEMIKDHPLTGIGFGMQTYYDENLLDKYNERVPAEYRQPIPHKAPHNLLVDIAVRTGLVGFALFLYIIFKFVQVSWQIIKSGIDEFIRHWGLCFLAAFVAVFIQGQFENIWWGPPAIILYTTFAMTAILWNIQSKFTKFTPSETTSVPHH